MTWYFGLLNYALYIPENRIVNYEVKVHVENTQNRRTSSKPPAMNQGASPVTE